MGTAILLPIRIQANLKRTPQPTYHLTGVVHERIFGAVNRKYLEHQVSRSQYQDQGYRKHPYEYHIAMERTT